jgi:MerR family transcriptional regulator, redox-sensitive transcriptional activator SoxR
MSVLAELTIGEVARRAGVATSQIRYYERIGLLPAPDRVSGQRRYDPDVLGMLGFISVAQNAGFKLREIKELLDGGDGAGDLGTPMRSLSLQKLDEVDALLERTLVMRSWLEKAKDCGCSTPEECALFPAAGESHSGSDLALRVVEIDVSCRRPDDVIPMPTVPPSLRPG